MAWIYKITSPENKIYVGSTIHLKRRWEAYKYAKGKGQPRLFASFAKHGIVNHKFEVITECDILDMASMELAYGVLFDVKGPYGLNIKLPIKNKIDRLRQCGLYGDLLISSKNFQRGNFRGLSEFQKELLQHYVVKEKKDPKQVVLSSLENYYGRQLTKMFNHLF